MGMLLKDIEREVMTLGDLHLRLNRISLEVDANRDAKVFFPQDGSSRQVD